MQGDLQDYRTKARLQYSIVAHRFVIAMYTEVGVGGRPCLGLMNRLNEYFKVLVDCNILTVDHEVDDHLPDMNDYMANDFLDHSLDEASDCPSPTKLDRVMAGKRRLSNCHCDWDSYSAATDALNYLDGYGVEERCKWCLQCFQAGRFRFLEHCQEHATASSDDDDDDDDSDDNDEDDDGDGEV